MVKVSKGFEFVDKREMFKSFVRVVQSLFRLKVLSEQELELVSFVYLQPGFRVTRECLKEFRDSVGVNSRVSSQLVKRISDKGYFVSHDSGDLFLITPLCLSGDDIELRLKFSLKK